MMISDNASETFGTLLRRFRKRQHFTQQQLAERLSLHRNTIGRWEEGSFLPESKALILELAQCLHLTEAEARHLLDASFFTPTPVWSVPYPRNPFFTGRESLLADLYTYLAPGKPGVPSQSYALHGIGGIGKTQLALEYAYRYALAYGAIFWIGAETPEQIQASMLHIAQRLDLPERVEADQQRVISAVHRWLETHHEWLVIWDNVEQLELLQRFLPALRHGAILLTTRQQAMGTLAHPIELLPMEVEEGTLFLFRRAKRSMVTSKEIETTLATSNPAEYTVARELVTRLGGLPLALDQAGAYLEETRGQFAEYMKLFQHAPLSLLRERGTQSEHPTSVVTTFGVAFERLQQQHPAAAALLTACCFLAAEEIPEDLFTRHARLCPPVLQNALSEPLAFQELLKRLLAYALIQRHPERQTLEVHRLVQTVLREQMNNQTQREWKGRIVRVLNVAFPEVRHEVWEECERLLPHVLVYLTYSSEQEVDQEPFIEVLCKAADYLRARARYAQAQAVYQRVLHLVECTRGPGDLSAARLLHHLAFLCWVQGNFVSAESLGERAVHIREQHLGPVHPEVATSLNSLANFALDQGKYEQAERLHQRVLQIRQQVLEPFDPALATSFNNLGILAAEQGKQEQAEELYQRALAIFAQAFSPDHPEVAGPLNNLALLYTEQGKHQQARDSAHRALTIWEQTLGPQHPLVGEALKTLARLSTEQGGYDQAETLYQRALALFEQALGAGHPQVAATLHGMATLARRQGKYEQAELWYQRALALQLQGQGEVHPETAQTLADLALLRQQQGKLHEACSLAERAWQSRLRSFGQAHPKTAAARAHYAQLVQEMGSGTNRQDMIGSLKIKQFKKEESSW